MAILQTVNLNLKLDNDKWIDTGVIKDDDNSIRILVSGVGFYGKNLFAYPEGSYANGQENNGPADPSGTITYAGSGKPPEKFYVTNTQPYSVAACIRLTA
jgi:hypothetical protein